MVSGVFRCLQAFACSSVVHGKAARASFFLGGRGRGPGGNTETPTSLSRVPPHAFATVVDVTQRPFCDQLFAGVTATLPSLFEQPCFSVEVTLHHFPVAFFRRADHPLFCLACVWSLMGTPPLFFSGLRLAGGGYRPPLFHAPA